MRRFRIGVCSFCLLTLFATNLFARPQRTLMMVEYFQGGKMDNKLINWIKSNVSAQTLLPLSFYVPADIKTEIYSRMGEPDEVAGIIERIIVEEGLVVYDGAVGQIALTMTGGKSNLSLASIPVEVYWEGQVGELANIRAGSGTENTFIYDPKDPAAVSGDPQDKGSRGFIFRIINAHGKYSSQDPLDGKEYFEDFPTWPTVHWEDWKPVAGENAWVVMAALHLYHRKYFNEKKGEYQHDPEAIELKLAEEIARAALFLQTETGGIRMAPLGTYRNPGDCARQKNGCDGTWWYHQISTENNLSWYGAFRMLFQITGDQRYEEALTKLDNYFQRAFNPDENYFYQGMNYRDGEWHFNDEHFALDVQTWAIAALGPEKIDSWFGDGCAMRMWEKAKATSGVWDQQGVLAGVGYTDEHDRLSVEWTAGAIMAMFELAAYYKKEYPLWALKASLDGQEMRQGIDSLKHEISGNRAAYSYSSVRAWIPFGWYSHEPEVLSLASTGWVLFVDARFNPFYLPQIKRL